ncbi:MAG: DUF4125 family protein [Eubacterium sp.]|nr:DUF4125 family protein [Eubacterium sp.]MDD7208976.1 DUF4125 family protein [Lachnospiraceae bacterium]
MERAELEKNIVAKEWDMFQKVKGIDGRASCQDDWKTFFIMRISQFESWDLSVLKSYYADLLEAEKQERNLVMEKYAFMMEETDPVYFLSIRSLLPEVSEKKELIAEKITSCFMKWEQEMEKTHPNVRKHGRPAEGIGSDGTASFRNYLKCELYTYSERTLALFLLSIEKNPDCNRYKIAMEKMVQAYGYASLDEAEKALSNMP